MSTGTAVCKGVPIQIGKSRVLLIDTPGFDDTSRSDSEILAEISKMLAAQYELGVSLKGVIYLHRITDLRFQGSSMKTLQIFTKICGVDALKNVVLATNRWDEVVEAVGADREQQLRTNFWAYMLSKGSIMTRFYGDRPSAVGMVSQLLGRSSIVLDIQRELVDEGKTLNQTTAGAMVNDEAGSKKAEYEQALRDLEDLRRTLQEQDQEMRKQIQKDWADEKARLQKATEDQKTLRRDVAAEVRDQINTKKEKKENKKKSGLEKALPFLPSVLGFLGMFVGLPTGSAGGGLLTSWLSDSGIGDSVTEFFSNF